MIFTLKTWIRLVSILLSFALPAEALPAVSSQPTRFFPPSMSKYSIFAKEALQVRPSQIPGPVAANIYEKEAQESGALPSDDTMSSADSWPAVGLWILLIGTLNLPARVIGRRPWLDRDSPGVKGIRTLAAIPILEQLGFKYLLAHHTVLNPFGLPAWLAIVVAAAVFAFVLHIHYFFPKDAETGRRHGNLRAGWQATWPIALVGLGSLFGGSLTYSVGGWVPWISLAGFVVGQAVFNSRRGIPPFESQGTGPEDHAIQSLNLDFDVAILDHVITELRPVFVEEARRALAPIPSMTQALRNSLTQAFVNVFSLVPASLKRSDERYWDSVKDQIAQAVGLSSVNPRLDEIVSSYAPFSDRMAKLVDVLSREAQRDGAEGILDKSWQAFELGFLGFPRNEPRALALQEAITRIVDVLRREGLSPNSLLFHWIQKKRAEEGENWAKHLKPWQVNTLSMLGGATEWGLTIGAGLTAAIAAQWIGALAMVLILTGIIAGEVKLKNAELSLARGRPMDRQEIMWFLLPKNIAFLLYIPFLLSVFNAGHGTPRSVFWSVLGHLGYDTWLILRAVRRAA